LRDCEVMPRLASNSFILLQNNQNQSF
jgi:hypothetical protein